MCAMAKNSGRYTNRIIAIAAGLAFALWLAPTVAFAADGAAGLAAGTALATAAIIAAPK